MGQAKQRKAEINNLKAGQSLFRYIADSIESKTIDGKMNALATVSQTLALVYEHLPNYTQNMGTTIPGSQFNDIARELESKEGITYMPKNINSDVWILSHLKDQFDRGLDCEALFNTIQYWMMEAKEDMTGVHQFAVMVDEKKFGTDKHKEAARVATFLNYGPVRVIVLENKDKSTSLVLSHNDQYEDEDVA
jgi:hypothetical protein